MRAVADAQRINRFMESLAAEARGDIPRLLHRRRQALAKVERGHTQDVADVREMVGRGFVDPARALELFERIEPQLYRYPALDPRTFRHAVESAFGPAGAGE